MARGSGRVRSHEDRRFNLNNIKKGAEKRAHDDFLSGLKNIAGISINPDVAKDVAGVGKSINSMTREMVNGNIHQINQAVINSASNGERSNTLTNFMGVSKMGLVLLSNSGVQIKNKELLQKNINLEDSVFNKTNMEQLNKSLIDNKVIAPNEKVSINNRDIYKSFKQIEKKMDILSSEKLGYDISKMNTPKLISALKQAKKDGKQELVNVIETQIGINELTKQKSPAIRKTSRVRGQVRRLVSMNVESDVMKGFNTIMHYKSVTKTLVKGTNTYYKGIARGVIKSGDFLVRGSAFAFEKAGLSQVAKTITNTRKNVIYAKKTVDNKVKRIKVGVRNKIRKTPSQVRYTTGKVVKSGALKVGSKVQSTKIYQSAASATTTAGRYVHTKFVNSGLGKVTSRVHKVGLRVSKRLLPKTKIAGRIIATPFKMAKGMLFSALKGLNVLSLAIKKVAIIAGAGIGGLAIASTAFVMIVGGISVVGDAVSNSLEDFKTKTTMGATYDKLLQKEQEFNAAVMDLPNTIGVPEGYAGYNINKYTNVNVHYLGADGREISWSGAVGDVNVDPSEVTDTVWRTMKRKGWTDFAIAGLLGNMQQESSFNVTCTESSSDDGTASVLNSGYGLCQWTNTQGNTKGRRYKLFQYAFSRGKSPANIEVQLEYLLNGEGSDSRLAREYGVKEFSSVAEATEFFCNKWERPKAATAHLSDVRIPAAQKFYAHYANNPEFSNINLDDVTEDISGDEAIIASGYSTADTTTIKGILAMAAVYIDQDFKKYGSYTDGIFADSVYKDYCAKLYDSSHIIGIDQTSPVVYYDPALSANEPEPKYHVASADCDNKIHGGSSESDWLNSGSGMNRKFSLSLRKEQASYDHETTDDNGDSDTETIYYDKYEILETGPHGSVVFDYDRYNRDAINNAKEELLDRGCKHYTLVALDRWDGGGTYAYVCYDDLCRGHIDAEAYVFVANIYDPSSEVATVDANIDLTEGVEGEESSTVSSTNGEAFEHVEKTDKEYKYSLYALDKYATAFDRPDSGSRWVYCTNSECSHYNPNLSMEVGYVTDSVSMVEITEDAPSCPECGTILNYPVLGRPGDQESYDAANSTANRAAEQFIMEDLTGKPIKVIDWWKNEGWFTSAATTKTYFRLPNLEDSIDTLKPDPNSEDKNVVHKGNSTPYWFNAFTSTSGRNTEFELHGWDNDAITLTRLLMASDWTEMYGIKDFGFVQGAPMTSAQIAQIIANNPDWKDLPIWRQRVMSVCASLSPGHPYVWSGKASSPGLPVKGLDCSGFTQWAYWTALGVKIGGSTGQQSQDDVSSGKLIPISASELLPGDIGFKFIGGSSSQSNSNHVGIYAGMVNGVPVWCHESGSKSGYKFKAAYPNFTVFFRINPDLVDDSEFSASNVETIVEE